MYILTIVLTVIISVLLIIVVLVQKSKGGGLSSTFAGSNQIMGVRRTNDFIEKATWTLAGIICLLSILSVFVMPSVVTGARSKAPRPRHPRLPPLHLPHPLLPLLKHPQHLPLQHRRLPLPPPTDRKRNLQNITSQGAPARRSLDCVITSQSLFNN